ncbi:MAG: ParB/RepB/Spo0J family partition protein [Bacteroidales bacterium]|nr:ParB/RepB/Spo0J family partition protein [Bacteroidales bacterium]
MAKQKSSGLGRGLSKLLPDAIDIERTVSGASITTAIDTILLDSVDANPYQPRKDFDEEALAELSQSIAQHGVITPITVRRMPGGRYQIVAGERRTRAARMAGLTSIPAYIRTATDGQMMEMALVENIQREDLNAMEVAFSYSALIEECNLTHEQLSERIGKSRASITNYLRLLSLPAETQLALSRDEISMAHARALAGVEDAALHAEVLHRIIDGQLSVRQTEQLIHDLASQKTPLVRRPKEKLPEAHDNAMRELKKTLQSEVEIKRSRRGKGTITIHFNSDADFERLMSLLRGQ